MARASPSLSGSSTFSRLHASSPSGLPITAAPAAANRWPRGHALSAPRLSPVLRQSTPRCAARALPLDSSAFLSPTIYVPDWNSLAKEEGPLNFTPEQRASIVANYFASGMTQRAFCADGKLSARTLRSWMRQHAPRPQPVADVVSEIDAVLGAVERLRARVAKWQSGPSQDPSAPAAGNVAELATMPQSAPQVPESTSAPQRQSAQAPQPAAPPPSAMPTAPLSPPRSAPGTAQPPQALDGSVRLLCPLPGFTPRVQAAPSMGSATPSTTAPRHSAVTSPSQPPPGPSAATSSVRQLEAFGEQLPDGVPTGEPDFAPEGGKFEFEG